jgi:LytS/YehU family sensor histidine kinase
LEAHRDNGLLRLTIENEFDAETPAARKSGLGLVNVRSRLRARYENRARLDTEVKGDCFLVELTLPCEDER